MLSLKLLGLEIFPVWQKLRSSDQVIISDYVTKLQKKADWMSVDLLAYYVAYFLFVLIKIRTRLKSLYTHKCIILQPIYCTLPDFEVVQFIVAVQIKIDSVLILLTV